MEDVAHGPLVLSNLWIDMIQNASYTVYQWLMIPYDMILICHMINSYKINYVPVPTSVISPFNIFRQKIGKETQCAKLDNRNQKKERACSVSSGWYYYSSQRYMWKFCLFSVNVAVVCVAKLEINMICYFLYAFCWLCEPFILPRSISVPLHLSFILYQKVISWIKLS